MTATSSPAPPPAAASTRPAVAGPVTLPSVIRSEWIKLRSLRSTVILLALAVALMVATGLIVAAITNWKTMSAAGQASFDPIGLSMRGVYFAGFTMAILGVLVVTGEYSTGMIRPTLCAVPRRLPVLWGKALVLAVAVFAINLVASFTAFLGAQAILAPHGVSLASPVALRSVFGAALFLTVMALLGVGFGFFTGNTAAGIAAVIGLTFVLPDSGGIVPAKWQPYIVPYLPMQSGQAIFTTTHDTRIMLPPWPGFALFCGYAAVAIAAAAIMLQRRDTGAFGRGLRIPQLSLPRRRAVARGQRTAAWSPSAEAELPGLSAAGAVSLASVIRSEWIKLRSLRSTGFILGLAAAHIFTSGLIVAALTAWKSLSPVDRANFDPITKSLSGAHFAGFMIIVLGVLVITGEYASGTIGATFCAVPRRLPVLWAKAAVFAPLVFVTTLAALLAGFFASQWFYGSHGLGVSIAAPGALRAVFGAALFLTAIGLLGLGLGFLARSTAGGMAAAVAVTFVLQNVKLVIPAGWQPSVMPYLPLQAGWATYTVPPAPYMLPAWGGLAALCGYTAAAIAAAAVVLPRRDASAFGGRRRRRGLARGTTPTGK
jgi:ABC-2 type transport system permease protein